MVPRGWYAAFALGASAACGSFGEATPSAAGPSQDDAGFAEVDAATPPEERRDASGPPPDLCAGATFCDSFERDTPDIQDKWTTFQKRQRHGARDDGPAAPRREGASLLDRQRSAGRNETSRVTFGVGPDCSSLATTATVDIDAVRFELPAAR